MKLTLADVALHDFGEIFISEQSSQGEPEEAPQRFKHTLRFKVKARQPTYSDNADIMRRIRGAVLTQQEPMLRLQDDNGTVYLNQTVRILSHSLPENPNERGTYLQAVEIAVVYYENLEASQTQCLPATYQRSGVGAPVIAIDVVESFKYSKDVRRLHEMRPHRGQVSGRIDMRGMIRGNPLDTVESRRAALLAAFDQLSTEITEGAEGTLTFASLQKVVRVDSFAPELNQAGVSPHIYFTLSCSFSEFPNETGYAQCEYTVATREDIKEGQTTRNFSGKIEANSEAAAIAKLTAVRATVTGGYTATRKENRTDQFSGEDGSTFFRLTFDEEYDKTTGDVTKWDLRISDTEEVRSGRFRRTYSGFVEATAAQFDQAYKTATDKARGLGDKKHQFKVSGQIVVDDKQLSADRQITGNLTVRVEFAFEYELTGTRVFVEISSEWNRQAFGLDSETVSGAIVCADASTARTLYAAIKDGYGSYLIRNEKVKEDRQKIQAASGTPTGATRTPGNAGTWGTAINAAEVVDSAAEAASAGIVNPPLMGAGYARQWNRLEFSFEIHRPKANGAVAMSYRFSVFQDFVAREKITTISGSVFASSEAEAENYLDAFIDASSFGKRQSTRREHEYVKKPAAKSAYTGALEQRGTATTKGSTYQGMSFDESFKVTLSGDEGILQCSLEEEIECSGPRVVVKTTAQSTDVFQTCGTQSGRRTISAECSATDEATALTWIKTQKSLPLSGVSASGEQQDAPPRISIVPEWEPLVTGVARGGTANVKLVRVRATFTRYYENITLV